jgi:beta-glucosidase/6-phospho-beta-glucosidase/beta-galactosidase
MNVIDYLFHSGQSTVNLSSVAGATFVNADIAADSYHRFREDVAAAKALKVRDY